MSILSPRSIYHADPPRITPSIFIGAGGTGDHEPCSLVEASLSADATLRLKFDIPPTLPTGTAKLRLLARAAAVTGVAKVNPKWASIAVEEDPSSATLNAETTQTVTWASGDSDVYKELKVTLDADTVVASEIIMMDILFETASWTLAADSGWIASIIWE